MINFKNLSKLYLYLVGEIYYMVVTMVKALFYVYVMMLFLGLVYSSNDYFIAEISEDEIYVGDVVKVYGYVYSFPDKSDRNVYVYLNSELVKIVKTDRKGYFEAYLMIETPGINIIKVRYDSLWESFRILSKASEPEVVVRDEKYYDRIIIVGDNVITVYPYQLRDDEFVKNQYVDIEVSAKELYIGRFKGSTLKINILNHLNETKVFKVVVEGLDDKDYFVDGSVELKPLERGVINLYISPLEDFKEKEIVLKIYANDEVVAEKQVIVKRTNKQGVLGREMESAKELYDVGLKGIISLLFLFAGMVVLIYGLYLLPTRGIKIKRESYNI